MTQDRPDSRSEHQILQTNTVKRGGTVYLRLPPRVRDVINAEDETDIELKLEKSEYGLYLSAWNPEQQDYENTDNTKRVKENQ